MEGELDGFDLGGDTDFDEDDVLLQMVGGRAALIPVSARRLPADVKTDLADVMRAAARINEAVQVLDELVIDLRDRGVSWSVIGWTLGMTGEGARQRFGNV